MRLWLAASLCFFLLASQLAGQDPPKLSDGIGFVEPGMTEDMLLQLAAIPGNELVGANELFELYSRQGKMDKAIGVFREGYERTHDLRYLVYGGYNLAEKGQSAEAKAFMAPFTDGLAKGEKFSPEVAFAGMLALQRTGDLELALQSGRMAQDAYRKAGDDRWLDTGYVIPTILEDMGRTLEASNEYEFMIAEAPGEAMFKNNYAYHLAVHNQDLPRALALVQQALKAAGPDGAMLDTEGFILLKMGRVEESVHSMVRAWHRYPELIAVRAHLAQALSKRKNRSETLQDLLDALATEPNQENTAEIDRLLAAIGE